jgi:hypothetical protein
MRLRSGFVAGWFLSALRFAKVSRRAHSKIASCAAVCQANASNYVIRVRECPPDILHAAPMVDPVFQRSVDKAIFSKLLGRISGMFRDLQRHKLHSGTCVRYQK